MLLKDAIAGALRAARIRRGLDYGDLADATHRTYVAILEQARANPTLEKLSEIADALELDLLTIVTLAVAVQANELPSATLQRVSALVENFESDGGWALIKAQFDDGNLIKRPKGKPKQPQNADAIRALKAEGLDKKAISDRLGLAPSTVRKYWNT